MNRGKSIVVVLVVVSLALSGLMQTVARSARSRLIGRPTGVSNVSGLDSFALGLILGGLRGPLVMLLWTSTENQKISHNLEDIDTKIELIRMLQPDFDSVHIFQIWNKAYNLSVQMTSLQNKYSMILDALDYAHRVNAERPDNINIITSIAEVYFNKLGNSSEKRVFKDWVRRQTMAEKAGSKAIEAARLRKSRLEPMLTPDGRILPELLKPKAGWNGEYDGAELQFLAPYSAKDGFPYGISPLALGYNYYKRAAALMHDTSQRHLQLSDTVIDSRAAIALKYWAESQDERGLRLESFAFGRKVPEARAGLEKVTQDVAIGTAFKDKSERTRQELDEAIFSYMRAHEVAQDAIREFRRHIASQRFGGDARTYASYIDGLQALSSMATAERAYLILLGHAQGLVELPAGQTVASLKALARKNYETAWADNYRIMLQYYTPENVTRIVYPRVTQARLGKAYDRHQLQNVPASLYPVLRQAAVDEMQRDKIPDVYFSDAQEYETYVSRAAERMSLLK